MIPAAIITEWSQQCAWVSPAQVEQDLVLSRALVEIYSDPLLRKTLMFRGGTALHKLIFDQAARYSEDLDFVQIEEGSIGETLDRLRNRLDPWLGNAKRDTGPRGTTLQYRFESEVPPVVRLRLKIEINTREHFHLLPLERREYAVKTRWFEGIAHVPHYAVSELLGTKMRALYQRRKGRDLFDLWYANENGILVAGEVIAVFQQYMKAEDSHVTREIFRENLWSKLRSSAFLSDTPPLLRPGIDFDPVAASEFVDSQLLASLH